LLLAACGGESAEQKLLTQAARNIITPWYIELDAEAVKLVEQSGAFCQAGEEKQNFQQDLQQQWRDTMTAWARAQPIGFGPIEDANLRWKLQFWPDRKDLTRKKVEALIAGDDELSAERVATASVSVQGLAALEYMLFDARAGAINLYLEDSQSTRRCQLLQAIAVRIQQVTHQLAEQWRGDADKPGYAGMLSQPGADNALYPDDNAALAELLNTLVVGAEVVKRNKLGIPIGGGKGASHAKPYRLEAWRSQHSLALMRASVSSLEQLYRGGEGYGLADYLAEERHLDTALLQEIDQGFIGVKSQFTALSAPLFSQLKEPQQYAALVELHQRLKKLQFNLNQLPERLGIKLGFNSNDGD